MEIAEKVIEEVKEKLDKNGDGVVDADELKDIKNISVITGVVVSVMLGAIVSYIKQGFAMGVWDPGNMFDSMQYLIPSIVILYVVKTVFDNTEKIKRDEMEKYEKTIDKLNEKIEILKEKYDALNDEYRGARERWNVEKMQLKAAIETKDLEISWLRNGYKPPDESKD